VVGDGSAGQGLAQAGRELLAIELLAGAVALDDDEASRLDPLVRGEPGRAGRALAPAPDRGRIVEIARVDDPRFALTAMGTAHRPSWHSHHYRLWCRPIIPLGTGSGRAEGAPAGQARRRWNRSGPSPTTSSAAA